MLRKHEESSRSVTMTVCTVECDAYRLGDVFSGYFARHFDPARVCAFWPASLACGLASGRVARGDFCRSLQFVATDDRTVYVHLRLGDVLDWSHYRHRAHHYVWPPAHYNRTRLPRGVHDVRIVGDPGYRTGRTGRSRSDAYVAEVAAVLRARGMTVAPPPRERSKNASAAADDDFRTLVFARHVVLGRGGYAALASRCRRERYHSGGVAP